MKLIKKKKFFSELNLEVHDEQLIVTSILGSCKRTFSGLDLEIFNLNFFFYFKASFRTFYSTIESLFAGVKHGYFFELIFVGLGYRFIFLNNIIILKLGYGHYIKVKVPKDIYIFGYKKRLIFYGIDLVSVLQFLNKVQAFSRKDIYKGKGINFLGKKLKLKVGKQKL